MDGKTPESFGQQHFGGAALGHKARTKRLVETADQLALHPGGTLPTKLAGPADLKGCIAWSNILRSRMPACWTRM